VERSAAAPLSRLSRLSGLSGLSGLATALGSIIAACFLLAVTARGTPDTGANGDLPAVRWPENKTIRVYIEPDPDAADPDRSALIKEGMDRWGPVMSPRGITIEVKVEAVPDPEPDNLVKVLYKPVGTTQTVTNLTLGAENHACAKCGDDGDDIVDGEVLFRDDIAAGTDAEKEFLKNLAQHEITHVIGLADDVDGLVTNHVQDDDDANTFNETDLKEIESLYPTPPQDPPEAEGETTNSVDPDQYDFTFTYNGLPNGHVALITMDVAPEFIVQVTPPPGWIHLDPSDPLRTDMDHPYYQGYMEDGATSHPPWDPDLTPPLAFRALSEASTLSVTNPVIQIGLSTTGAVRGPLRVWAGGEVQTIVGPAAEPIPLLPGWAIALLAAAFLAAGTWSIRGARA